MAPTTLYTFCVLGALGLYLVVRTGGWGRRALRAVGAVLALGTFGYLVAAAGEAVGTAGGAGRPGTFYLLFSVIAVVSAVKMVTHVRPVYSALYFILVVLSSAGLFLLLEAEFMAFALIIVYAGAILITYLFVLMLAQQAPDPEDPTGQPEYDLNPREPAAGAIIGFILLALLSRTMLDGAAGATAPDPRERRAAAWAELRQMPARVEDEVARTVEGDFELVMDAGGPVLEVAPDARSAVARYVRPDGEPGAAPLGPDVLPENVQSVGLALIAKFPVSLELAGVVLLMAMLGAVILARRQIELTEDEKREAAGLRRLGLHDEIAAEGAGGEAAR